MLRLFFILFFSLQVHASIEKAYQYYRNIGTCLAGNAEDISQRVLIMHHIFLDSNKNYYFPEIALHGAAWAEDYFGKRDIWIKILKRFQLNNNKVLEIEKFKQGLLKINRQVFIDTFVFYYLSKYWHEDARITQYIPPNFSDKLELLHLATAEGQMLSIDQQHELFYAALVWEQEINVGPKISQLVKSIKMPYFFKRFLLSPKVRFAYFPLYKKLYFHNFSNKDERIAKAMQSYNIARKKDHLNLFQTLKKFKKFPKKYLKEPLAESQKLLQTCKKSF